MNKKTWDKVVKNRNILDSKVFALLSKYKARATYARNLQSQEVEGLSKATSEGYFSMLRLGLSFTALEMLLIATGATNSIKVYDPAFAKALEAGYFKDLLAAIEASSLQNQREKVWQSLQVLAGPHEGQTDLLPLIRLCRHLMFHGAYSPSETKLATSQKRRMMISELATIALDAGDDHLDKWISSRIHKANRTKKLKP